MDKYYRIVLTLKNGKFQTIYHIRTERTVTLENLPYSPLFKNYVKKIKEKAHLNYNTLDDIYNLIKVSLKEIDEGTYVKALNRCKYSISKEKEVVMDKYYRIELSPKVEGFQTTYYIKQKDTDSYNHTARSLIMNYASGVGNLFGICDFESLEYICQNVVTYGVTEISKDEYTKQILKQTEELLGINLSTVIKN